MKPKEVGTGVGIGLLAGAISWWCCISAIVLGFLGLGAASAFLSGYVQDKYHWHLVVLAFICMDVAIYYMLLHYHGSCSIKTIRNNLGLLAFIVLVAVLAYFLFQAILPPIVGLSQSGL